MIRRSVKKSLMRSSVRSVFSVWFLALLFTCSASAQMASFKHYGLDKSIFPSRIECIDQTDHGELLIGTLAGLVIYDGFEFTTKSVKSGLAESSISSLSAIKDRVYIGHWAGNISIYHVLADTFSVWNTAAAFDYASVVQIIPVGEDLVYAITSDDRMFTVKNGIPERIALPANGLSVRVKEMHVQNEREIVVTTAGIYQRSKHQPWKLVYQAEDGMTIESALPMASGRWALAYHDRIRLYAEQAGQWTLEQEVSLDFPGKALIEDPAGRIWVRTSDNGVYRYDPSTKGLVHFERQNGLSYNQVRAMFTDREGNVWIATAAGLDQFLGDAFTLIDQRSGLEGGLVWDVELANGKFFALTPNGILTGKASVDADELKVDAFIPIDVTEPKQAAFDGASAIWIMDQDGDLWKLNTPTDEVQAYNNLQVGVNCLELVNGALWVGTDEGVFVMDEGKPVSQITAETGLAGDKVTGIYYSRDRNETWITVLGAPTTLYYEGKFRQFGAAEGISSSVIQDAAFDQQGLVWFATYDKGVFRYLGDGSFEALSNVTELTSNTTFAIEVDEQGVVWVGHNWGVDAYDPQTKEQRWYGEDDGFMGVEVNAGAMRLGTNGILWMGTLMGMLRFDPSLIHSNEVEPSLEVQAAKLGAIDLLAEHPRMDFLSTANDLTVRFSSIALKNPARNRYYYRLKGVHENWREMDEPGTVEYISLPPGDFIFELKACNDSDVCSKEAFALNFSIYHPFYRTWWFYTIVFLLVILAIFFMDRYRAVNLLEQKHEVEEQLALKEQHMVDLREDMRRVGRRLEEDASIIEVLEETANDRSMQTCEVLQHFKLYQRKLENVSSDGVLCFSGQAYHLVILVDVGVVGNAAHALRSVLYTKMEKAMPTSHEPSEILAAWEFSVKALENKFTKFKGVQWFLYTSDNDKAYAAQNGLEAFTFNKTSAQELLIQGNPQVSLVEDGLWAVNSQDAIAVVSDGLFSQLNESGTRSYGKAKFLKILEEKRNASQEQIKSAVWSDIEDWTGAMEQFDDMTLFIWNHV